MMKDLLNGEVFMVVLILLITVIGAMSFYNLKGKRAAKSGGSYADNFPALRLQACERLILLMERINPTELALRYAGSTGTVTELQLVLLNVVRTEAEHNYSQQLYVSSHAWEQVVAARHAVMNLINQSAAALKPDDPAMLLSKQMVDNAATLTPLPTFAAIQILKVEARLAE
ncbi:MAG: hypothetical protein LBT48_01140 [Prevotellaceae bacterium]|jgi:hypothetical protein|nr:hypothetical protein [Prevotellaceae bacterium]